MGNPIYLYAGIVFIVSGIIGMIWTFHAAKKEGGFKITITITRRSNNANKV